MKIVTALLLASSAAFGQSTNTTPDSLYMVTYTVGELWNQNKKPNDQPYFKEHSALMGKLMKEGTTKLGARYADKGMIIMSASSMKDVKDIILNDVAITNKLFSVDIQKLDVFFNGYTVKSK